MTNSDIKHFKQLLELYYSGTASAEQEQILMRMAETADPQSVPEDLRIDVTMLRDLSALGHDASAFATTLNEITAQNVKPTFTYRRKKRYLLISTVAAAAIAAIVVFVGKIEKSDVSPHRISPTPVLAEASAHDGSNQVKKPDDTPLLSQSAAKTVEKETTETLTPALASVESNATHHGKTNDLKVNTETHTAPMQIEVTDPEVAAMIVERSLNLLATNITTSGEALNNSTALLQSTIKDAEQTLNNIL